MQALGIVGMKKSGKTGLALALAEELTRRGHSVAALKTTHTPRLDKTDSDTGRMLDHCVGVGAVAGEETAMFWPRRRYPHDILPLLTADFLIVEGGKSLGWLPRVLLPREASEVEDLDPTLALATYGETRVEGLPRVADAAVLADLIIERGFMLPGLDCGECGFENCAGLARRIVSGKAEPQHCKASSSDMEIRINGQPLALNHFVRDIVAGSVLGMLRPLKGYAPGGKITIMLRDSGA